MNSKDILNNSRKPWILFVILSAVLLVGGCVGAFILIPHESGTEYRLTQSQTAIEKIIDSIMNDPNLTDDEKTMLKSVFSNLSEDAILTMDDAKLVIQKLLDSGLCTEEETKELSSLMERILNGDMTDLNLVKGIIGNILDNIKTRISSEMADETPTGEAICALIEKINNDPSLTDDQKRLFISLLTDLGQDGKGYDARNIATIEQMRAVFTDLINSGLIKDPATLMLVQDILTNMENGKEYDITDLQNILNRVLYQISEDKFLSEQQRKALAGILERYGLSEYTVDFKDKQTISEFISRLLSDGFVTDASLKQSLEDLLKRIANGDDINIEEANALIRKALANIYDGNMSDDMKNSLRKLFMEFGIDGLDASDLKTLEDARLLLQNIKDSGIITDKDKLAEIEAAIAQITNGTADLEAVKGYINELLDSLYNTRLEEELGMFKKIGGGDDDIVTHAYLNDILNSLMGEYSSSYSFLEALSSANAEDIETIKKQIAEDKTMSEEERQKYLQMIADYDSSNSEALSALRNEMQTMLDENSNLDADTKKYLTEMIALTGENTGKNISDVQDALNKKLEENAWADKNTKDQLTLSIKDLESQTDKNLSSLKHDLSDDLEYTRDTLVDEIADMNKTNNASIRNLNSVTTRNMNELSQNITDNMNELNNNTLTNFYNLYSNLQSNLYNLYDNTQTNFDNLNDTEQENIENIYNSMGDQVTYTIDTDSNGHPVLYINTYCDKDDLPDVVSTDIETTDIEEMDIEETTITAPEIDEPEITDTQFDPQFKD